MIDGYMLDDSTVKDVIRAVSRRREVALYGFTSHLDFVARSVLERQITIPRGRIRAAWNGGEMLHQDQSDRFERAFGVPLLNAYGGRELSAMACQESPGAALTVMRPIQFVEILDKEGNEVGPGETGRLVWTNTVCRGTPFLRYDVGDLGRYEESDRDESGVRAISRLEGRSAGLIELPDGKTVGNLYWNHLFKEFSEVEQFQTVYLGEGKFRLLLRGDGFTAPRLDELQGVLKRFMGQCSFEVQWVDDIPRTREGKLVQVVTEH